MAKPKINWKYVDRPAVTETFCDYLQSFSFDGQTLRFEFCVERLDEPIPSVKKQKLTGKRYTCARLVLTPDAGQDLYNKLHMVVQQLQAQKAVPAGSKPH